MRQQDIDIITSNYRFSHGREPRGRGSWAFQFGTPDAEPVWCPGSVTYATARRWALNEAVRCRAARVYVCP